MSSIKRGSKEFYEVVKSFEMSLKAAPIYVGSDLSKVTKEEMETTPAHYFYNNGNINNLFWMFMSGYVAAKMEYMN